MIKFILYEIDEELHELNPNYGKSKQGSFKSYKEAEERKKALEKRYKNLTLIIEEK